MLGYLGVMALAPVTIITPAGWVPEDTFGARLVLTRLGKGLTQEEAATACGLDDGSWSNWERGTKPRGMDEVVRKIAGGLGVSRDWLMWGYVCPNCGGSGTDPDTGMTCFLCNPTSAAIEGQGVLDLTVEFAHAAGF